MKYKIIRPDGVIEFREDNAPLDGAIPLTDEEYAAEFAALSDE